MKIPSSGKSLIQFKYNSITGNGIDLSSAVWTDTGLYCDIVPLRSDSSIVVSAKPHFLMGTGDAQTGYYRVVREVYSTSTIGSGSLSSSYSFPYKTVSVNTNGVTMYAMIHSVTVVDTPATTNWVRYKVQFYRASVAGSYDYHFIFNSDASNISTINLREYNP